jgi:LysR family transcriptional regulator (chromosome initiation inhibitor)
MAIGRPVLRRVRPVELTPAGEAVVRFACQLELLSADLSDQFEPADGSTPRITLVVNGDSLHTWALAGLVEVADRVQLTILREDQDHSLDLLRARHSAQGTARGASSVPNYLPSAGRHAFDPSHPIRRPLVRRRRQPHHTLHPPVVIPTQDDLQDRYLRRHHSTDLQPPRHYIPATHEFGQAIQLGLGWGMLPELQLAQLPSGTLTPLTPTAHLDVPLFWQQWRLTSTALDHVASAITNAAQALQPQTTGVRRQDHPRKRPSQGGPTSPVSQMS